MKHPSFIYLFFSRKSSFFKGIGYFILICRHWDQAPIHTLFLLLCLWQVYKCVTPLYKLPGVYSSRKEYLNIVLAWASFEYFINHFHYLLDLFLPDINLNCPCRVTCKRRLVENLLTFPETVMEEICLRVFLLYFLFDRDLRQFIVKWFASKIYF